MWPFRRKSARYAADPRHALVRLSKRDPFTLADAWEGVLVTGATGSGKSTGSGQTLALSYLAAGMGGLVLTAKKDERATWEAYCRRTGRLQDLRVFSPGGRFRFNFLDYELNRPGDGAGHTENLVQLFAQVLQIAERGGASGGGREDEGYWRRACNQLLRNAIDLLVMAKGSLSVPELYQVVVSAPTSREQSKSPDWRQSSFCFRCLVDADRNSKSGRQTQDFAIVADFFLIEFPALSSRTRSVIVSTFTSMIDVIHRGVLADLFCTSTNIVPEDAERGAIILIDLPVKEYAQVGQFAQVLWKSSFQRAIERRNLAVNPRSVFLWADECQYFVTSPWDMQFQTTCRASRVATVLLTQNTSNVQAALGGSDDGGVEANSLFGNLNTKVFHANSDPVTNGWASSLIGRSRQFLTNSSSHRSPGDFWNRLMGIRPDAGISAGVSEHIDFEVQPKRFTTLRRGGPASRFQVDAIVFQGGRRFQATGKTWMPVVFSQKG